MKYRVKRFMIIEITQFFTGINKSIRSIYNILVFTVEYYNHKSINYMKKKFKLYASRHSRRCPNNGNGSGSGSDVHQLSWHVSYQEGPSGTKDWRLMDHSRCRPIANPRLTATPPPLTSLKTEPNHHRA